MSRKRTLYVNRYPSSTPLYLSYRHLLLFLLIIPTIFVFVFSL